MRRLPTKCLASRALRPRTCKDNRSTSSIFNMAASNGARIICHRGVILQAQRAERCSFSRGGRHRPASATGRFHLSCHHQFLHCCHITHNTQDRRNPRPRILAIGTYIHSPSAEPALARAALAHTGRPPQKKSAVERRRKQSPTREARCASRGPWRPIEPTKRT